MCVLDEDHECSVFGEFINFFLCLRSKMQSYTAPKSIIGDLPTEDGEDVRIFAL